MKIDFKNKNILVTGASSGIGKFIAYSFYKLGGNVIGTSTTQSSKKKNFLIYKVNFLKKEEFEKFCSFIKSKKIDILINNAGINKIEKINNLNIKDYNDILFVNLKVPTILTKIISQNMIKKKSGKIINISSIFGSVSKSQRSAYSSSKFGLIGFTKSTSLDLAKYNILVNSVSPGFIDTKLTRKILKKKGINKMSRKIPLNRLGNVKEISSLINFLSSKYNTYITGQNMIIDGGFTSE